MLNKYAFMSNILLCKILSMLYDSNSSNPYIYVLFFNTCLYVTHIYILLALRQNPPNIDFFKQCLKFSELARQFSLDMSDLWPRHIQLAGHVWLLAQIGPSLRFQPIYIRGLSTPLKPNLAKPLSCLSHGGQGSPKMI
jgi:hypothetical protein